MSAYNFFIILLCFSSAILVNSERFYKVDIKALEPKWTSDQCFIEDLERQVGGWDHIQCSSYEHGIVVLERTYCRVYQEDLVFEFQCIESTWKPSTGTDIHIRSKRFLVELFTLLTAVVSAVVVIYCTEKTGNSKCEQREVQSKDLVPPKYTRNCPPREVRGEYTADSKQTTVKVSWSDPVATDDEEVLSNEQTCCDYTNGSEFPGLPGAGRKHTVTYTAKDNYGLSATCSFSFLVKYLTCTEPAIPYNGRKVACPNGYLYGGQCTFDCDTGYTMTGSSTATCKSDETWESIPTCQKKVCNPPFGISNGKVECDDASYSYDEDCTFVCNDGFRLSGPRKMTCQANQSWSVKATDVACVDDDAPVIQCKSPQVFYADQGGFSTTVRWEEPTATDNVDSHPVIQKLTGPSQGDILSEGFHHVQYKATDSQGNSHPSLSQCAVTLEVKVIRCSTGPTDALANSTFMTYNCTDTSFYNGVSCTLNCQLNLPLNGTDLMKCERNGITDQGVWSWGSGPQPFCKVVECPALDPPANGAYTTDSVNARPLHVMFCQKGYDISSVTSASGSLFTGRLSCQDSGKWFPLDQFPDCIVSILPWLTLPAELYYEGNCNDKATEDRIKQQVLVYLTGVQDDVDQSICPDPNTCKVENVVVVCGTTSGRKRREAASHGLVKRQTGYALVTWDIKILFDQGNKTTQAAYLDFLGVLNQIKSTIQDDVNNGACDIAGFTIPSDGFQTAANPNLECDSGYKRDTGTVVCKPCPAGTYLNSTTNNCEYCKVGSYMDHEGAVLCVLCPEGYSTLSTGTKHRDSCIKLCAPGFFSSSAMEPCSACLLGTYQHARGQTGCQACPPGTSTSGTNSTTSQDCQSFDISVSQIPQRTFVGSFSAGGASVLVISLWIKPQSNRNGRTVTLYFSDSNGNILTLTVTDVVEVGAGTSSLVRTSRAVLAEHWTHVTATIDLSSRTLHVYIDDTMVIDQTSISVDSTRTINKVSVEIQSQSDGLLLSGLSVYPRVLTGTELTDLTQSCSVRFGDEIASMTDLLNSLVPGMAIVTPSSCDPVDECQDSPCAEHKCINKAGGFQCVCHGGMTGTLCDIPPDYCLGNKCIQGDCVQGNKTYTCSCRNGYTGVFCDKPPVDGDWTAWSEWDGCDVTCGGGRRSRIRTCTNPVPSPHGQDCQGNSQQQEDCNTLDCPVCPSLHRKLGTVVSCVNDDRKELLECNMTCLNGKLLPNGQKPFEKYWCGASTSYEWLPIDKTPECVDAERPDIFGTQVSVTYNPGLSTSDETPLMNAVKDSLSDISCVQHHKCDVTSYVSVSASSRRRRASTSILTLQFSIKLIDNGDLSLGDYLNSRTVTSTMAELLDAIQAMTEVVEFIKNNTASVFDVQVNGVRYSIESNSTSIVATVTCAQGSAGADGLCAKCAAGSRQYEILCVDCEPGTYQPLAGQTECLPCPSGYTTDSFGASDISECSVVSKTGGGLKDDDTDESDDDDDHTVTIAVVTVSVTGMLLSAVAVGAVLWKKCVRRRFRRNNARGSFASLSMVQPDTTNSRTCFNTTSISSLEPPECQMRVSVNPPSYESHGFEILPDVRPKCDSEKSKY